MGGRTVLNRSGRCSAGHNYLFGPGPDYELNACVGRNGGPADFQRLAFGYFEAGNRLVESLELNPVGIDGVIYPVVNVYRQGIELYIKHLCRELPFLLGEQAVIKPTHKMLDNWTVARSYLDRLAGTNVQYRKDVRWVERTLRAFVEADPNGECFRYPEAKDSTLHLQDMTLINAAVLGRRMTRLGDIFDTWTCWVEDMHDRSLDSVGVEADLAVELDPDEG